MSFLKSATVAVLAVAAVGASTGVAAADPSADVHYAANIVDQSVVTTIDAGAFRLSGDGKSVVVQDSNGAALVSLPLAYNLGDLQFPFERQISEDGRTLTLTPVTNPAQATPKPATANLQPVASPIENDRAIAHFQSQLGLATQVGSLTGTIVGAVVGCALAIPLGSTGVLLPAAAALCLGGIAGGAGIGGVLGTIATGGGTAVVAGIELMNTLNAPAGTTVWATP